MTANRNRSLIERREWPQANRILRSAGRLAALRVPNRIVHMNLRCQIVLLKRRFVLSMRIIETGSRI